MLVRYIRHDAWGSDGTANQHVTEILPIIRAVSIARRGPATFSRGIVVIPIRNKPRLALFSYLMSANVSGSGMPYQVKAGSVIAIVANEKQALELLRRMAVSSNEQISIRDIFGGGIDVATLESRLTDSEQNPP
jgi:hypothetical protein